MHERRNNFDGLRLLGALAVFGSHLFVVAGLPEPKPIGPHSIGNLAVMLFFAVSGYLVMASWQRDPDARRFVARRFLRLVPGLAALLLVSFVALDLLGRSHGARYSNPPLWTLPIESACYALVAICGVASRRPAVWVALVIGGIFIASGEQYSRVLLGYFGLSFAMGALLYAYPVLRTGFASTLLVVFGAFMVLLGHTKAGLALVIPPLAIAIGSRSWPLLRDAARYGDLSYGIYIYAWPAKQLVFAALGPGASIVVAGALSLALTIAAAWLSWRFVEAPALAYKPTPPARERLDGLRDARQARRRVDDAAILDEHAVEHRPALPR